MDELEKELRDEIKGLENKNVELEDEKKELAERIEKMQDAAYDIYQM